MAAQGHDQEIASVRRRLAELAEERKALEARLEQLLRSDTAPVSPTAPERGGVTAASPAAAKVALFRDLFSGRPDVFPVRWENAKAGRAENARAARRSPPFAELEVENRRGAFLADEATLASAVATAEQVRLAYELQIDGVNTTVARLLAELRSAQYDLDETTVRAPTDGYVTQLFLRPGMMAVPLPLRPVMVFLHNEDQIFVAAFQQNVLQRIRVGDEAEIAFDAIPGRIIKGRVTGVIDAVAQGQLQPTGALLDPEAPERRSQGRALTQIRITDDISAYQLPGGAAAQVAVYTEYWHHFAVIRRILLRMKSWLNYVFTEGH